MRMEQASHHAFTPLGRFAENIVARLPLSLQFGYEKRGTLRAHTRNFIDQSLQETKIHPEITEFLRNEQSIALLKAGWKVFNTPDEASEKTRIREVQQQISREINLAVRYKALFYTQGDWFTHYQKNSLGLQK